MEVIMQTNDQTHKNVIRELFLAFLIAQIPYIIYAIEVSCRWSVQQYRTGVTTSIIEIIPCNQNCEFIPYITPRCVKQYWSDSFQESKCLLVNNETMLWCGESERMDTNIVTWFEYGTPKCKLITNYYVVDCMPVCEDYFVTNRQYVTRHEVFTINGEDINYNPCISTNK